MLALTLRRRFSSKIKAPPMVYISGEEMSRVAGQLYLDHWINPYVDTQNWQFFDLSCKSRDQTDDQILKDAITAGKKIGAIYKEPTITPTEEQKVQMGLKKAWGSPNGAMRRGWNGITISRDTIQIPGMELGYKNKVLFDRHAVGGEYGAGYKTVDAGKVITLFQPKDSQKGCVIIDERQLVDKINAVVFYHNPYDNVNSMAHHFFGRCLEAKVTPYIVTKKTVFKWQEEFWRMMKQVFDEHYKSKFNELGLLKNCRGELQHFLSDVATMNLIKWTEGNFGMCAHNYDGDVLTDELAQIHKSPGFITSVLNGVRDDGSIIKEFEASHGTVTDMYHAHLRGEETSLNCLSMMEALIGAMQHSAVLDSQINLQNSLENKKLSEFSKKLQDAIYAQMTTHGQATRDLSGKDGLTTQQFVMAVKDRLDGKSSPFHLNKNVQPLVSDKVQKVFLDADQNKDGKIDLQEFNNLLTSLGVKL